MGDVPWRDDLLDKPLPLEGSYLALPTDPGLGVRLNHREVSKYRVE
jgi:L-alanine-DL-glutamate epimerase-like enolase superfamily enzyme